MHVSNRGTVVIQCKKTGKMDRLSSSSRIFAHDNYSITLKSLFGIGVQFTPEEFVTEVPAVFKPFYTSDSSGDFRLTIGGFVVSSDDEYRLLSPKQAALEELRREQVEEKEQKYFPPLLRCSSPVHVLKNA